MGEDSGQALAERRVHEHVHGQDHVGDASGVHQAREHEAIREPERADLGLDLGPPRAVAHEEEFHVGKVLHHLGRGTHEVLVALHREYARHLSHHERVLWNAQLRSHARCHACAWAERVDLHAAVDGGVEIGPAHSRGQGLLSHRVGHGDDLVGPARG